MTEANYRLPTTDGAKQVVDFSSFLKRARHPQIAQYRDLRKFNRFKLQDGELMWGDFELIFPIMDLNQNRLQASDT